MSYRLISANDLNGVFSDADYEKVLNMPCVFVDLPNGMDGKHYDLQVNSDEDCISKTIEAIKKTINDSYAYFENGDVRLGFDICKDIIDKTMQDLPNIQSKQKTRHCKDCKYFEYDS